MAVVMVFYLGLGVLVEEKRVKLKLKATPTYLMYAYIGLCFLSSVFSSYKSIAFWGISERYEGFFVLLSYAVFFVMAMSFASGKGAVKPMLGIFMLSAFFIGLIGCLQTFGYDFFATDTGSKLVLGQYYGGENLSMKFGSAYATLYNPNCLGMYAGMMSGFMLMLALMLPFKSKGKYVAIVMFVMSFICMLGSDSVGGLLGFGCACMFALIVGVVCFFAKKLYKNKVYLGMAVMLVVLAVAVPSVLFSTNAKIVQKAEIITDALKNQDDAENNDNSPYFYKDFSFDADTATIATDAGDIKITATEDGAIVEQNGKVREVTAVSPIQDKTNGITNTYSIDGLAKGELQLYDDKLVFIGYDEAGNQTNFLMRKTESGIIPLDKFGVDVNLDEPVKSVGFNGLERLGSGRGYIWSRSIPVALKNIVIGKGPDSFALEFPQYDIVSKLKYLGNPYIIVDKPHSLYLQTAINTGVLSLVAVVLLVILYLVQSVVRLVKSNDGKLINAARLACCAGVVAYMAAGATTDSVVSVAPVFWIMLGTGYGINFIKSDNKDN
jgi:hypothetical protein